MAAFGAVQFTGFANGTLPEVETTTLGLRVTIKPNDPGVEAVYGSFSVAASGSLGAFTNLIMLNHNSDILIRPKRVQVSLGTAPGTSAAVSTIQLFLARDAQGGPTDAVGIPFVVPTLRTGKFAGGQYTSSDTVNFVSPISIAMNGLTGQFYSQDANPIASITTSGTITAGNKVPVFTLWDTSMGDDIIDLQDGMALVIQTLNVVGSNVASFSIQFDQVDPKLQ